MDLELLKSVVNMTRGSSDDTYKVCKLMFPDKEEITHEIPDSSFEESDEEELIED